MDAASGIFVRTPECRKARPPPPGLVQLRLWGRCLARGRPRRRSGCTHCIRCAARCAGGRRDLRCLSVRLGRIWGPGLRQTAPDRKPVAYHHAQGGLHAVHQGLRQAGVEASVLLGENDLFKPGQPRLRRFDVAIGFFQMYPCDCLQHAAHTHAKHAVVPVGSVYRRRVTVAFRRCERPGRLAVFLASRLVAGASWRAMNASGGFAVAGLPQRSRALDGDPC